MACTSTARPRSRRTPPATRRALPSRSARGPSTPRRLDAATPRAPRSSSSAPPRASRTSRRALRGRLAFAPAVDALNQLRGIAALGLGDQRQPRPAPAPRRRGCGGAASPGRRMVPTASSCSVRRDAAAAQAALDRMRSALADRGSRVTTAPGRRDDASRRVAVPQIGTVAYAMLGRRRRPGPRSGDDVAAALEAHAAGETLGDDERYRPHLSSRAGTPATNSGPMCRAWSTPWPASSTREANFAISSTRSASLQSAQPPTTIGWKSMAC